MKLKHSLKNYKKRDVIVISSIPEVGYEVPSTLKRSLKFKKYDNFNNFTTSFKVSGKTKRYSRYV